MITVPIPRVKPEAEGSYRSIIPMLGINLYHSYGARTGFQENKKKVAQG